MFCFCRGPIFSDFIQRNLQRTDADADADTDADADATIQRPSSRHPKLLSKKFMTTTVLLFDCFCNETKRKTFYEDFFSVDNVVDDVDNDVSDVDDANATAMWQAAFTCNSRCKF